MTLLFFRGRGVVPFCVRLLTCRWWEGQAWADVPAHVALFWGQTDGSWIEIEAVVTGVRRCSLPELPTEGVVARFDVSDADGRGRKFAAWQVGKRYGFEAALATGLASVPIWRQLAVRLWAAVGAGRTVPLDCELLAEGALSAAGYPLRVWDTPPSPNELMLWMEKN